MKKALLLIPTFFLMAFSWHLPIVNSNDATPKFFAKVSCKNHSFASHSCEFFHSSEISAPAFGQEMGKVIKEKHFKKSGYKINTIVIDAGHGGFDSGCLGPNSQEKHIALGIAKKLAKQIEKTYPDVEAILTRDKDYFIPLHKRAEIANQAKADLFISIHANYIRNAAYVKGSETYVLGLHKADENLNVAKRENASVLLEDNYEDNYDFDPNSDEGHIMLSMYQNAYLEQSILFAEKVENKMASSAKRRSRGVKQAGFLVLHQTTMPAVLVETGFLSNDMEEHFLMTDAGQLKIATAIQKAFGDYKNEMEAGKGTIDTDSPIAANSKIITPDATKESVKIDAPSKASIPKEKPAAAEPFPPAPASKMTSPINSTASIQFRVQLAASPKPLDLSRGRWKKVDDFLVEVIMEKELYKYQARNFSDFYEAETAKKILRKKGFNDAFVVAYQNGQRLDMNAAKAAMGIIN